MTEKYLSKKMDSILKLISILEAACEDEPERLCIDDIKSLTKILEKELIDAKNYIST